jgi:class 3 adenylate cyclase
MDIGGWLQSLGLERYEAVFRENEITEKVLPNLTAEDLRDLGVVIVGHRRTLLDAIAVLRAYTNAKALPSDALPSIDTSPKDTAERRQVTVMFSDLVGSTALSARMDPEDLREVISAYQKRVAETVQPFGGFVAKYMGDGVLVYFGYPQAHEDDAERAVRAGLKLIQAVSSLKSSPPLQTRVGIATGLVVVGDLVGSGEAQERGIVGETPNLAARLQGIAEPNIVVIAESTRRLLGNLFELEDLGAKDLKGVIGPVRAWAALRPASVESRFEALHASGLTELVGREEELEILLRRWSKAKSGEGQVVLLSGEAGIGKSRLTAALLERLATEPHIRLRYFCSSQHTDSAFYPIIGQMERAAGLAHDDTPQVKLDKLDAVLAQTSTSKQDAALFADMLSLPNDGRYPALDLEPQQRRQKTLEALTAQIEALSRQNPVLMIFEDAHWTDPTSLEVFGRVVDRVRSLRALLIVTFRPEFDPPWVGRAYVIFLAINRLGERETLAMIEGVVGNKPLPTNIRQDIIERTDGIPLFVEEMTKAVLEAESQGAVEHLAAAVPSSALAVPASLQASLMARLDRVGQAKEVAQIGAAIGREFSHALLAAVARLPEAELAAALDRLLAAGLLFRRGVPPHTTYLFKHALVQDAAYSTLLRSRRQQLHARIATTLESRFPEGVAAQPAILAQHCTEAGFNERAVDYRLQAGQKAVARSAMTEAAAQLRKGLDLLAGVPDGQSRQQQELGLRLALGPALIKTRGYSSAEMGENLALARGLAEQIDRADYLVLLLYGEFYYHMVRSEHRLALSFAARMEQIGDARDDAAALLLGRRSCGIVQCLLGEFAAAHALFEQCRGLRQPAVRRASSELTGEDDYCVVLAWLGATLAYLGYLDQARSRSDEAVLEARGLQHTHTLALCLFYRCWVAWVANLPHENRQYAEAVLDVAGEHGYPLWAALGTFHKHWSSAVLGEASDGVTLLTQGLSLIAATGTVTTKAFYLARLAEVYALLAQPAEGLSKLKEGAQFIEATEERIWEADLYRVQGDLLNATDDHGAAEVSFHRALAVARRQSAKTFELRAATSLARLWRAQGKRDQARELLAPVYGWFTEGFDTPVLRDAKSLLDVLESLDAN